MVTSQEAVAQLLGSLRSAGRRRRSGKRSGAGLPSGPMALVDAAQGEGHLGHGDRSTFMTPSDREPKMNIGGVVLLDTGSPTDEAFDVSFLERNGHPVSTCHGPAPAGTC